MQKRDGKVRLWIAATVSLVALIHFGPLEVQRLLQLIQLVGESNL